VIGRGPGAAYAACCSVAFRKLDSELFSRELSIGPLNLSKPAALLERARDLVKLPAFCQLAGDVSGPPPEICGALDRAMPRRVIVVDRLPQPEIAAPLGWSLSQSSRNALNDAIDAQVKTRCDGRSSPPSCRLGYAPLGELRHYYGVE
jgi:hypothetical protein